ncbi:MAG TPA: TraR/DksA C4-type zinc finger protein [Gemmatimonadaceae bacterium]|jgi:hypothetical protein
MEGMTMNDTSTMAAPRLTRAQRRELEHELRHELARLGHLMGDDASAWTRPLRVSVGIDGYGPGGLTALLHGRAAERHQALVNALERMEKGGYGICVACQQPIPYGRLIAMPESAYCVACGARA